MCVGGITKPILFHAGRLHCCYETHQGHSHEDFVSFFFVSRHFVFWIFTSFLFLFLTVVMFESGSLKRLHVILGVGSNVTRVHVFFSPLSEWFALRNPGWACVLKDLQNNHYVNVRHKNFGGVYCSDVLGPSPNTSSSVSCFVQRGSGELPRLHEDAGTLPAHRRQREEQRRERRAAQQQEQQTALWVCGHNDLVVSDRWLTRVISPKQSLK